MPGSISVEPGAGGLSKIVITAGGTGFGWQAVAEIYLNGATVTRYDFNSKPVLFCSRTSKFETGKAIRGGVPIIFPWFGPHPSDSKLPQHGLARAADWDIDFEKLSRNGEAMVALRLDSTAATRAVWPYDFSLEYYVTVGKRLELELIVTNQSSTDFRFDEALHTYLAVSDVRSVEITGLERTEYVDKVDAMARKRLEDSPLTLRGETDRVFLNTGTQCRLHDPVRGEILVGKEGSLSTVIWNPWEKAENMPDLAGNQWPGMVCVETVNAMDDAVTLASGEAHTMKAVIDPAGLR